MIGHMKIGANSEAAAILHLVSRGATGMMQELQYEL
jgi:hypothetical protein